MPMTIFAPSEIVEIGSSSIHLEHRSKRWGFERKELEFHKHFGSSPLVIAVIWEDLCRTKRVKKKERNEKGMRAFLVAHHFLWTHPKNLEQVASRFDIGRSHSCGDPVWKWMQRIQSMKEEKIKWLDDIDEIYAASADGVDFKIWEKKHPKCNIDRKACSHKFNSCAAKCLIALSVHKAKCVLMAGPFDGGVGDLEMMELSGLKELLIRLQKKAILDRGFFSRDPVERETHCHPSEIDSKELHNFKSRVRLRHETFNRRLAHFEALSNTFRHGTEKHEMAFEAIVVIVQCQMDNGSPIFTAQIELTVFSFYFVAFY